MTINKLPSDDVIETFAKVKHPNSKWESLACNYYVKLEMERHGEKLNDPKTKRRLYQSAIYSWQQLDRRDKLLQYYYRFISPK